MTRAVGLLLALAVSSAGCGPVVDLTKGLQILDVSTGWFDAGLVDGKAKLVPSITFKLKNVADQRLIVLQVNALFRRMTEKEEWGSGFVTVVGSEGLGPGETTPPVTIRSQLGYTGSEQSRAEMLQNSQFVDAKVEIFAKYASHQWARLSEFPIARQLLKR